MSAYFNYWKDKVSIDPKNYKSLDDYVAAVESAAEIAQRNDARVYVKREKERLRIFKEMEAVHFLHDFRDSFVCGHCRMLKREYMLTPVHERNICLGSIIRRLIDEWQPTVLSSGTVERVT